MVEREWIHDQLFFSKSLRLKEANLAVMILSVEKMRAAIYRTATVNAAM